MLKESLAGRKKSILLGEQKPSLDAAFIIHHFPVYITGCRWKLTRVKRELRLC